MKDGGLYYELTDLLNWSMDGMETGTLMKITYDDGTVGYLSKGFTNYTEQSLYGEDGTEVASISTVNKGNSETSITSVPEGDTADETDAEESSGHICDVRRKYGRFCGGIHYRRRKQSF